MATFTWVAGASGSVASGGNWLGGHAPGTADVALFPAPGTAGFNGPTIKAGTSFAIAGLTAPDGDTTGIELDGTLLLAGTLLLGSGSSITAGPSGEIVGGTLSLNSPNMQGGTLDGVTVVGSFASADAYLFQPAAIAGGFTADVALEFGADTTDLLGAQTLSVQTLQANILDGTGNVTLDGGTLDALEYNAQGSATTLALAGTVALGVSLYSVPTLVNSGLLSLVQSASLETLVNSGTISVGPSLDLAATLMTNTGSIAVAAAGTLGAFTLDNAGGLIAVASGGRLAGSVTGGTLVGGGGTIGGQIEDATLTGAFLASALGLTLSGDVFARDSQDHAASVTLTFGMTLAHGTTLNDVNIVFLDGVGDEPTLSVAGAATFGTATDISFTGTGASQPTMRVGEALTLGGTLEGYAGTVDIVASGTLLNTGTLATLAGETLSLYAVRGTIENQGVLNLASGSTVELRGNLSATGFAGFAQPGVTLVLDGTLSGDGTPAGSTITLGAGAVLQTSGVGELIENLTIDALGPVQAAGTYSNVVWQGAPFTVGDSVLPVVVQNGFTVQGTAGTAGEIDIAGTAATLQVASDLTLDNVTVTIGATLASPGTASTSVLFAPAANLTIGPNATLDLGGNQPFAGIDIGGTLILDGALNVQAAPTTTASGAFVLQGQASAVESSGSATPHVFLALSFEDFLLHEAVLNGDKIVNGKVVIDTVDQTIEAKPYQEAADFAALVLDKLKAQPITVPNGAVAFGDAEAQVANASSAPAGVTQAALVADQTTIAGTGALTLGSTGVVVVDATIGTGVTLAMTAGADLVLVQPSLMAGSIAGFGGGNGIDLFIDGYTAGTVNYVDGQLLVPTAAGTVALNVAFAPGYSVADVQTADDTQGGTAVYIVVCFAEGTRIATPDGEQRVETLRPGDRVRTASGQTRPVVWVGHRAVDCRRHPRPHSVSPVRVRAGAFGPGRPARDLILSPDHALFLDGVLVPVRCLIDGDAIAQLAAERVTYWHVELDRHDILLAEGLPAESFLDTGQRAAFAGGAVAHLHPDFTARAWDADAYAPLVLAGPKLARIRGRLRRTSKRSAPISPAPPPAAASAPPGCAPPNQPASWANRPWPAARRSRPG